jgi:class 3 adenylate cyclase
MVPETRLIAMPSYTRGKNALIRLAISCAAAAVVITGVYFLQDGPTLGRGFDFLLSFQGPPPIAPEVLVIETAGTDTVIDPSTAAQVIMTMAELEAQSLLIQTPVLGVSTSAAGQEAELLDLFNREFDLLDRNIQNLFDGIRMGTVPPAEANHFVETVLTLAEEGKQRLVDEAVHRNKGATLDLEQSKAVFQNVLIADDHSVELARQNPSPGSQSRQATLLPLYSHAVLDTDGRLRRVIPLDTGGDAGFEHIAYNALKNRFGHITIAANPTGRFLIMEKTPGFASSADRFFTLDKNGAIIVKALRKDQKFRTIDLVDFIQYEKLDRAIYKTLGAAADMGVYGNINAEKYPPYLWEQEQDLRRELLKSANDSRKAAWIDARNAYTQALDMFFYESAVEENLNASFAALLQNEHLSEEGQERIITMRDDLLAAFHSSRDAYNQFAEIRARLSQELAGSLCILGAASADTLASALLANTMLTGNAIIPASARYIFFWSLCAAFLCVLILCAFSPSMTFIAGIVLCAAVSAGFAYSFIVTSVWIDPFIPAGGAIGGVLVSAVCSMRMKQRLKRTFRLCYGPFIAKSHLEQLIRAGRPKPEDSLVTQAAVIAVKNPALNLMENTKPAEATAPTVIQFHNDIKRIFLKTGAVVTGASGDTILAVFGSPVERAVLRTTKNEMPYDDGSAPWGVHNPMKKAAGFLAELIGSNREAANWYFGMDYGKCAFLWTPLTGYTVLGPAAHNARKLAAAGCRSDTHILISKVCADKIDGGLLRKHPDSAAAGTDGAPYELLEQH